MMKKNIILFLLTLFILFGSPNENKAQVWDMFSIGGYYELEFEKSFSDDYGDPNGSFDMDLFDLVLNFRPSDRFRISADLTWEHGPATESGQGNVAVEYAFAEYSLYKALKIRGGKMFTAFGIYNEIHTAKPANLSVKEPFSTNKPKKIGGKKEGNAFFPRWQTGIAALGTFNIGSVGVDYIAQISNGDQRYENPENNNENLTSTTKNDSPITI